MTDEYNKPDYTGKKMARIEGKEVEEEEV